MLTTETVISQLGRQRDCPAVRKVLFRDSQGFELITVVYGTWCYTGKIWRRRMLARYPDTVLYEPIAFGWGQGNDQIALYRRRRPS